MGKRRVRKKKEEEKEREKEQSKMGNQERGRTDGEKEALHPCYQKMTQQEPRDVHRRPKKKTN